jgi:alpha-mannosidase
MHIESAITHWESASLRRVRFWAADVPAMGYKVFELRRTHGEPSSVVAGHSPILENKYYRVELDPTNGAVRSIFDKELRRDLVDQQSPYRFGQYLYAAGGDQLPNTLRRYRFVLLQPKLQVNPARDGRLLSVTRTPYGSVARMESTDTNTPSIQAEIRLFDHEKKIEFVEVVDKVATTSREAVYFAFPFAMNRPQFQYEIQTGVVDPAKDMYPGAGHEWFSVQHWVSAQQNGFSATVMPLDASLVTLGDINRGAWPDHFGERPGTIFSYAMNNYWGTNYNASQGGRFRFRYVVTSAQSTNPPALSRMGWGEATPLELNEVIRQDKAVDTPRRWDGRQGTYLTVDDSDLLVETWKTAENGDGTILRCLDLGGETRQVKVRLPLLRLTRVVQTDAVERDQQPLAFEKDCFSFTIHPHEIVTLRVVGDVETRKPTQ